jgi:ELWxxDGT repeat protein
MKNKAPLLLFVLLAVDMQLNAQPWANLLKDACPGSCGIYAGVFYNYNNKVYYLGSDDIHSSELWVTDGTTTGTNLLKDINADPNGYSDPFNFTGMGNKVFFTAIQETGQNARLYVTDGTTAGTVSPKYIIPSFSPFMQSSNSMMVFNNEVYFTGSDSSHTDIGLWKTDGSYAGTTLVAPFTQTLLEHTVLNNKLYMIVEGAGKRSLWVTDGTSSGTNELTPSVSPQKGMQVLNNKLYFLTENDINSSPSLYVTDGTTSGTEIVSTYGNTFSPLLLFKNKLYFVALSSSQVYIIGSDGTTSGTERVLATNALSSTPLYVVNDEIIALTPNDIFHTDGTATGSSKVTTISSAIDVDIPARVFNNKLYFTSSVKRKSLWATDGTATGTAVVDTSIAVSLPYGPINGDPFIVSNNKLYFEGREWVTRTTPPYIVVGGRSMLRYIDIDNKIHNVSREITTQNISFQYTTLGSDLIITANDSVSGIEVWKISDFPTGVQEASAHNVGQTIYPNPATNTFSITLANNTSSIVKVYGLTGQLMLETTETQNINIAQLPAGIYMVQITSNAKTYAKKLIKK